MKYVKVEDIEGLTGNDRLRDEIINLLNDHKLTIYNMVGEVEEL